MTHTIRRNWRQLLFSKYGLVLAGFLLVAGYFLWAEHQAHILGNLPLILLLGLCAGMHLFMHGGHGGHGGHDGHGGGADAASAGDEPENDDPRAS